MNQERTTPFKEPMTCPVCEGAGTVDEEDVFEFFSTRPCPNPVCDDGVVWLE